MRDARCLAQALHRRAHRPKPRIDMNRPLSRLATRAAYGASQLPRIAWYLGHGLAMTRIAQRARESSEPAAGAVRPSGGCGLPQSFVESSSHTGPNRAARRDERGASQPRLHPAAGRKAAHGEPDTAGALLVLDAHPLLANILRGELREQRPEAWRAAHRRLYEHLCATTKDKAQPRCPRSKTGELHRMRTVLP